MFRAVVGAAAPTRFRAPLVFDTACCVFLRAMAALPCQLTCYMTFLCGVRVSLRTGQKSATPAKYLDEHQPDMPS